ncbi:MAG TPA: hypothetical protein VF183_05990 [Acidimicrobiales bacterium]
MSPPMVVYAPDLLDRSRIAAAVPDAVFVRRVEDLLTTPARVVVVDLGRPGVLDIVPQLDVPVIGFGSHVDDALLAAATDAGCAEVLPRSRFFRRVREL